MTIHIPKEPLGSTFYLGTSIEAQFYISTVKVNGPDLIDYIQNIFPDNQYFIAHVYIFQSAEGRYTPLEISIAKSIFPINYIYSHFSIPAQIQILAIKKCGLSNSHYIKNNQQVIGLFVESSYERALFLDGIGFLGIDFTSAIAATYELIFEIIQKYKFTHQNIVKFWNYIQDILVYYPEFNKVRDRYFFQNELFLNYPAGTGIDCRLPNGLLTNTSVFVYTVKGFDTPIKSIKSSHQCEAASYGPKFSRSKSIKNSKGEVLFVSGTAAVGIHGETLFSDSIDQNIAYTMRTIQDILATATFTLGDIKSAFIYLKKPEFLSSFIQYYKDNECTFPYIFTVCDVCRDDWLFEIECIATRKL